MGSNFFKHRLSDLLSSAGITVNGSAPWDITVHDDRFYRCVLSGSHLGAGESYMDGWWDAPAFDEFFYRTLKVWHSNIEDNREALSLAYDDRFHRMRRDTICSLPQAPSWHVMCSCGNCSLFKNGIEEEFRVPR